MNTIYTDFFWIATNIEAELNNPEWDKGGRVHNWKNYVDSEVKSVWHLLSENERRIIAYFADRSASNEDWD